MRPFPAVNPPSLPAASYVDMAMSRHLETLVLSGDRHSGIVNVNQSPSTLRFPIKLCFPPASRKGSAIFSELGSEIPIKLGPGRVSVNVNGDVMNAQFALRESIADQVRVDILLDLLATVLVAQRVDEGDIRRIQPDLSGESGVCAINRFRVFLDQAPDRSAVGG